jgi:ATP-dependent Clp protease adaptor protein ClpS
MEPWNFNKEEHDLDTESELLLEPDESEVGDRQIILYNDDVNTFDFVITSLIKVCKHDAIQAEQCTYLVHYKGKCSVKRGGYEELEPMCTALLERGLTAEIV